MDDMISRQAAINAFLTELTKRERKNLLHTWSTVEVKYFVADMLEKLPPAQSGWILCSERLPDDTEEVLTTYIVNGNQKKRYVETATYYGEDGWSSPCDEYRIIGTRVDVIAWMPLPEPYKGEQNE